MKRIISFFFLAVLTISPTMSQDRIITLGGEHYRQAHESGVAEVYLKEFVRAPETVLTWRKIVTLIRTQLVEYSNHALLIETEITQLKDVPGAEYKTLKSRFGEPMFVLLVPYPGATTYEYVVQKYVPHPRGGLIVFMLGLKFAKDELTSAASDAARQKAFDDVSNFDVKSVHRFVEK